MYIIHTSIYLYAYVLCVHNIFAFFEFKFTFVPFAYFLIQNAKLYISYVYRLLVGYLYFIMRIKKISHFVLFFFFLSALCFLSLSTISTSDGIFSVQHKYCALNSYYFGYFCLSGFAENLLLSLSK